MLTGQLGAELTPYNGVRPVTFTVTVDNNTVVVNPSTPSLATLAQIYTGMKGDRGEAGSTSIARISSAALGGHRMVANTVDGRLGYASSDDLQSAFTILGMTLNAVSANGSVEVQSAGLVTESTWTWTPNLPIYLGLNGLLTQAVPTTPTALFSLVVGFALSPTSIFINLHEAIYLT